jgi:hypothetical protein
MLAPVPASARTRLIAALDRWGVTRIEGDAPVEVLAGAVMLESGRRVAAELVIGAAGAAPQGWLTETGLDLHDGFVTVNEHLRSTSHPTVYAAGDCAHFAPDPTPKAGVYAVRAAPVLARNLAADLAGRQRRAFRPQKDFLKLISMGGKMAVAEKRGLSISGPALWRWKDRIDARFMEKLRDLPKMPVPRAPADAATGVAREMAGPAPCGGCGAKLGAGGAACGDRGLRGGGARGYGAASGRRRGGDPFRRGAAGDLHRSSPGLRARPGAGGAGGGGSCAGRCLGDGGGAAIGGGDGHPAEVGGAAAGRVAGRGDGRGA